MAASNLIPQLVETTGPHQGRVHALPYGDHIIGRGSEASIRLLDNDVSRRHARVEVGPDEIVLHDLGSKNGVVVEGQRVEGSIRLQHGQSIALGDLCLSVSHPAAQVAGVLAAAGEATATTTRTAEDEAPTGGGVLLPLLGVLVFGAIVIAMLLV